MYSLLKKSDSTIALLREGKEITCPWIAPIALMSQVPGVPPKIVYTKCNSECALFRIEKVNTPGCIVPNSHDAFQTCGSGSPYKNLELINEKNSSLKVN